MPILFDDSVEERKCSEELKELKKEMEKYWNMK